MTIPTPPLPGNLAANSRPKIPAVPGNTQTVPSAPVMPAAPKAPAAPVSPVTPTVPVMPTASQNASSVKSCENCIFFIGANDVDKQIEVLGKVSGGSVCAKRGIFLTNIYTTEDSVDLLRTMADRCSEFNETSGQAVRNAVIDGARNSVVSFNQLRLNAASGDQGYVSDAVNNCQNCIFFNSESETIEKAGLPVKSCSRRNIVIRDNDTAEVAKDCNVGANVGNREAGTMLSTYVIDTHVGTAPLQVGNSTVDSDTGVSGSVSGRGRKRAIDPATAPDKDASMEDKQMGIRGWRKITSADDNSMSLYLPIFDPQFFADDQRAMIPMSGDDEHPEDYQDHQNLLYKVAGLWNMGMTPAVNGIPGTGKTEFFRYAAWVMQLPFVRLSIDNRTEKDDLAGKMHVSPDKGTYFKYGRLTSQWSKPCVMLVDEPNTGPDEVWQFLRPLTDNSKQLVLDTNEGERIQKHEHNFLGMAFNPAWDMRNVGTHEISAADVSRLMHIQVTPPNSTLERKIIQKACKNVGFQIPDDKLEKVMNIATDIRELSENDFPLHWGVREQIKVSRVLSFLNLRDAYRMAIADFLDPDQAEQIFQIVRAHDGQAQTGRRRGRPPGSRNKPRY